MIVAAADTHTAIWYLYNDSRLASSARNFIEAAAQNGNQIAVSSITLVEMIYLIEKGRIAAESLTFLASALEDQQNVFSEIPVDLRIARALARIDVGQVPDMPDRIIAATALSLAVPLISRDRKIQLSSINTIW